jgi:ubiquinone/menaquinone biosynthesis C-methylase UbiE
MGSKRNQVNVAKFDRWSSSYHNGRMKRWFTHGQAKTIDALELGEGDSLLDVGCGTGWAVAQASHEVPEGRACGIDISPGMISRATELADSLSNVEFKVGDAESIPYADESFDAVMCTNSFHHYSAPVRALSEMRRVLKPGGRLVIQDSDRGACLWVKLWDLINRTFEKGHVRYYSPQEVFRLLDEAGVEGAELVTSEHSHFRNRKLASAIYRIRGIEAK